MAPKWQSARIGDVAEVFDGPHATPKKTSSGPVFLGITTLDHGRLNLSDVEHLSEEDFAKWTRRVTPRAGDIVFSYETRLGEAALIPEGLRCCLGRRMGLVRAKENELDSRFFLYQYLSPAFQAFLHSRTIPGSTVDRIPLIEFPNFPIALPPIHEQRAIAHILGTLDDKIELNRRMNETLEAIAQAIFKSWFVDFDPVCAKASGEPPESICRRLRLTPDLLALFPDRLVDSELGESPVEWEVSTLAEQAHRCGGAIQTGPFGSQLHASDYVEEGVPVVMPQDLVNRRVSTQRIARISEEDAARLSRHRLLPGDIVYSRRGDVERHAVISKREAGWLCGTGCLIVRLGPAWPSQAFLSLALDRPETRAWLVRHAVGATMPNLNTTILGKMPLLLPPDSLIKAFDSSMSAFSARLDALETESETLAELRDTLLPKLLAGDVRLPAVSV